MGRGRQKAKQTKVARQLKYYSPDTDYNALQRELGTDGHETGLRGGAEAPDGASDDDAEDDYGSWTSDRRG